MKTMTCKQIGGACDEEFQAETWDEMAALSHAHGTKMHEQQDPAHLEVMQEMSALMNDSEAMQKQMDEWKAAFDATPEDS